MCKRVVKFIKCKGFIEDRFSVSDHPDSVLKPTFSQNKPYHKLFYKLKLIQNSLPPYMRD